MNQQRISNPAGRSGGYRSRYRAFLAQRNSSILTNGPHKFVKFGQGLINIAIFIVLFIGILTLFGFGLSRLIRSQSGAAGVTPTKSSSIGK